MDVDSYLPYEGKVVLTNKDAREAYVRVPLWVDKHEVACRLGDRTVEPVWFGNYVRLVGLEAGDVVTMTFPVQTRTEIHTIPGRIGGWSEWPGWPEDITLTGAFRGNTLVELSQPLVPDCPLYQNRPRQYQATRAPMTTRTRFATPLVLAW
jgi:hypothetical protein